MCHKPEATWALRDWGTYQGLDKVSLWAKFGPKAVFALLLPLPCPVWERGWGLCLFASSLFKRGGEQLLLHPVSSPGTVIRKMLEALALYSVCFTPGDEKQSRGGCSLSVIQFPVWRSCGKSFPQLHSSLGPREMEKALFPMPSPESDDSEAQRVGGGGHLHTEHLYTASPRNVSTSGNFSEVFCGRN